MPIKVVKFVEVHPRQAATHFRVNTDDFSAGDAGVRALEAHVSDPDPHPRYAMSTEVASKIEIAINTHEGLSDPHPQYKRRILKDWSPNAFESPVSNPAILAYRNDRPHLAFDDTTQETAYFTGVVPYDCDLANGLLVRTYWAASTDIVGTVGWDVAFEMLLPADADLDSDSFGSAQVIAAATVPGTAGQIARSSVTFSQAQLPPSIGHGEFFRLRIRRDVDSDTAVGDAELYLVTLEIP